MRSISLLSALKSRYCPCVFVLIAIKRSRLIGALTIRPLSVLTNLPDGRVTGPPCSVPTPIMNSCASWRRTCLIIDSVWLASTSSVSHTSVRCFAALCSSNCSAKIKAASALLPMLGIISGVNEGTNAAILLLSSVNGETICASPE